MKEIGIKLADGSFYPIMEDGIPCEKNLVLTTVKDNQTRVVVDMYRTKNRRLDDAEYIDSLQIDGLVPHPNGEVELSLNIGLDENNKLWSTMNDPETGGTSDANVTLVSRTLEERLEPTNYEVVGGESLLEDERTIAEDENPRFEVSEESNDIAPEIDTDFDMPDSLTDEEINAHSEDLLEEEEVKETVKNEDESKKLSASASAAVGGIGLLARAERVNGDIAADTVAGSSDGEFGGEVDDSPVEESVPVDEPVHTEAPVSADKSVFAEETAPFDEPVPALEDGMDDDPFGDSLDLDLPDFTDDGAVSDSLENEEISEETSGLVVGVAELESEVVEDAPVDGEHGVVSPGETVEDESLDDPFDNDILPDIDEIPEDAMAFEDDNLFNENDLDMTGFDDDFAQENESAVNDSEVKSPTVGGIDFGGLYDKETENGNSSYDEDEEVGKKTRIPVIICIVCAIICLLATALILFVVPSRYNLLNKRSETGKESVVIEQEMDEIEESAGEDSETADILERNEEKFLDEEISEGEAPSIEAKEDEIVVVTEPEIVETIVPEPAPVPETKPADILYKIKWGDTLWDISEAYYKTPWKYPKIARYNNIRNPDYIISGTTISIPAE